MQTSPKTKFLVALALLLCVAGASAQQPAAPLPSFDVVSIKPSNPNSTNSSIDRRDDGIRVENANLSSMISIFYGLERDGQMINMPDWAKTSRFDIDARVAPEDVAKFKALPMPQTMQMITNALVDRFKITIHHESREFPVYNLVIAKGGLKPAVKISDPAAPGNPLSGGYNYITMHNRPISTFTGALSHRLDRTVIDKTGLTGNYDLNLRFTPDALDPGKLRNDKALAEAADLASKEDLPTLFTAMQEELGLKLESAKGPVDCIVIDHIEQPSAN
jgi:uncharacterized protein (TIGR03435 family)